MSNKIDKSSRIGGNVKIGEYCVVGEDAVIGEGCVIGNGVIIHPGTNIGANVRVDDHSVLGKLPMKAANTAVTKDQELPPLEVGDSCIIGTSVVLYRGCALGEKVLVADLSTVRENVKVGDFTIIGRGVAIENFCEVGSYCKLETNVYLTAYSIVEDRVFIAPCVATSNDNFVGRTEERFKHFKGVTVKKGGRIGVGSVILPGKTIGADCLVAAGSVVTSDTPDKIIVAGVPAKQFRDVPSEQLLENQNWEKK
ncbi:MAG: N-acetyltransferase [candidate division Zixibacteria bacterium]|nr:N-acetyltransferase [candidate division Zixibacteria bacterium]